MLLRSVLLSAGCEIMLTEATLLWHWAVNALLLFQHVHAPWKNANIANATMIAQVHSEQLHRHPCPGNLAGREAIWCLYYMAHVWNISPLVMKLAKKAPAVKQTSISCHIHQTPESVCTSSGELPCAPSPGAHKPQGPLWDFITACFVPSFC